MASPSLLRIERLNYGLGGVLVILAALTQPKDIAFGIAIGVALTCLNFFVLRKLVAKWSAEAKTGQLGNSQLLMLPKMAGLMALCVLCLWFLPINAVGFTIGYSLFLVSIMVETIHASFRAAPPAADPHTSEHD